MWPAADASEAVVVITPADRGGDHLRELWASRELLYFLVLRDLKVRYRQTALGVGWALLQPLLTMLIFSVVFGRLARIPSDGVPYPLFAYAGLLLWGLFAHGVSEMGVSLVNNRNLLTKVYFPRLVLPLAPLVIGLVDLAVASPLLAVLMVGYGVGPGLAVLAAPLFVAMAFASALAVGVWLAALNVKYRDVRYTIPFLVQVWLFATPIAYPSSLLPQPWRTLYGLNPMAGAVDGLRWSLFGHVAAPGALILLSAAVTAVLLAGGVWYFRRTERTFADLI